MLGTTPRWVKRALDLGYFGHVKVGKFVRVRRSEVLRFIEEQEVPGDPDALAKRNLRPAGSR
jgi:hypothetical protein